MAELISTKLNAEQHLLLVSWGFGLAGEGEGGGRSITTTTSATTIKVDTDLSDFGMLAL